MDFGNQFGSLPTKLDLFEEVYFEFTCNKTYSTYTAAGIWISNSELQETTLLKDPLVGRTAVTI